MTFMTIFVFAVMSVSVASGHAVSESQEEKHQGLQKRSRHVSSQWQEIANNMLTRLMIVVEETLQELGASEAELREVQKKRSHITACYFQAVTSHPSLEQSNDYDTGLLDEIKSEEKRNFNEQKHAEVDEPFKNLLSELEDDIGELSDLNKRNNGGPSGKSPPQQTPVTTPKPSQTNSTATTLKPPTQSTVTSTASVTTTKAPVKANPQPTEKKPSNDSRESNAKTKKPPKGNAVNKNRKKVHPQGDSKSKDSKGKGKKNLRGRKKMKNRYRTDKNKMLAQASCGKAKRYPTCIQMYRKCMYERKKQQIRCKQRNGNNSRGRLEKYSNLLKGRKLLLTRHGLKQNRKGEQQQANKKNSIQDDKQWKNKGNNGKNERKSPQNNLPKNSPRKQEGAENGKGNNQSRKNQKGKSSPSGNTAKPLPINKDNGSNNVLKEKQALKKQKKLVNGEIKGLLKYLRRVKGHLYHIDKNDGKRRVIKTKGKSDSN
ncbi:uncharacterized protein DDB_G0290685-like [Saccostrea cucullata]|uniref:uncharacterized protein DDB_G0290685-like n=1 Tax=Saccostrea cuccullata TaxID=36930 RepID=UPI002ED353B3